MPDDPIEARSDPPTPSGRGRERSGQLDPHGAFVVRFRSASGAMWRTAGKVEHVRSGEELQFQSRQELLDFLFRTFPDG